MAKHRYAKKKRQLKRKRKRGYVTQGVGTKLQPRRNVFQSALTSSLPKTGGKTLKYFDSDDTVEMTPGQTLTTDTTRIDWSSSTFRYYISALTSTKRGTNVDGIKAGTSQSQRIGHRVFAKRLSLKMRLGQHGDDALEASSAGQIIVRVVVLCDKQANNTQLIDATKVYNGSNGSNAIGGTVAQRNMAFYKRYDILYDAKKVIRAPPDGNGGDDFQGSFTYCDITLPLQSTIVYTPNVLTGLPANVTSNNYYLLVLQGDHKDRTGPGTYVDVGAITVEYTCRLLYTD